MLVGRTGQSVVLITGQMNIDVMVQCNKENISPGVVQEAVVIQM
jgi:hypothetical protein